MKNKLCLLIFCCVVFTSFTSLLRGADELVLKTFSGHEDVVWSMAFSPDGTKFVSSDSTGIIKIWDIDKPEKPLQTFEGHSSSINSVAFSPDGTKFISAGNDGQIKLWNINEPKKAIQTFTGHYGVIHSVAFSPDGTKFVSASDDRTIKLWDINNSEKALQTFEGNTDIINSVAFSPDGTKFISGSKDNIIKLWDINKPEKEIKTFQGHSSIIKSLAFSPDGTKFISASDDDTIKLWDINKPEKEIKTFQRPSGMIKSLAFSPDGTKFISVVDDHPIELWDIDKSEKAIKTFKGHSSSIYSIAFSPDGTKFISACSDKAIKLWKSGLPPYTQNTQTRSSLSPALRALEDLEASIMSKREEAPPKAASSLSDKELNTMREKEKNNLMEKIELLKKTKETLLEEFAGWDDIIDNIMSAAETFMFFPEKEMSSKPVIIPMLSFPGYGKTTLVQRFLELMGLNDKYFQIQVDPGMRSLPTDKLEELGEVDGQNSTGIRGVIHYEEVDNLQTVEKILKRYRDKSEIEIKEEVEYDNLQKTIEKLNAEIDKLNGDAKTTPKLEELKGRRDSEMKRLKSLSEIITKKQGMIEDTKKQKETEIEEMYKARENTRGKLWEILGNGVVNSNAEHAPSYYYKSLQDMASNLQKYKDVLKIYEDSDIEKSSIGLKVIVKDK
ncbi:MAG: hypothetical protein HQK51_14650, partial [Oligoflexia bacterium]|nr:hypothetical protein [Oligoflexia bacterium]